MPSPIDLTPYWCRHRATKDVAGQEVTSLDLGSQNFPAFFMLNEQALANHRRVELRVAVKLEGMVQRILQVDVHAARFTVLTFPQRQVVDAFEISHLVQADYPSDLVIRLTFRQSVPGWFASRLGAVGAATTANLTTTTPDGLSDADVRKNRKKEPIWTRTFHTMSSSQRDYIGAILQGLVGLSRPLNAKAQLLCAPKALKVGRESLSVWTGSWNMGMKGPPEFSPSRRGVTPSIRPWLILDEREFDVYVCGVQEMDAAVFSLIDQQLGPEYFRVVKDSIGNIGLVIYIRKRLLHLVKHVESVKMATGFAGVGTNKGFVAASFTYLEQPMLFINCHLAARDDASRLRQRVNQIKHAIRKLRMGRLPGTDVLHQFNVWFFGDMNFRVCAVDRDAWPNSGKTRRQVVDGFQGARDEAALAAAVRFAFEQDQLTLERLKSTIFEGFQEGAIEFSPSYKYESFPTKAQWESVKDATGRIVGHQSRDVSPTEFSTGRAKLDLGAELAAERVSGYYLSARIHGGQRREYTEHKEQVPSWCDRILYRALPSVKIEQLAYRSVDDILTSDHSPVYASFSVDLPQATSAHPSAAFHVGAIQILKVEVFHFRHPGTSVESILAEAAAGHVEAPARADGWDDDNESIATGVGPLAGPTPASSPAAGTATLATKSSSASIGVTPKSHKSKKLPPATSIKQANGNAIRVSGGAGGGMRGSLGMGGTPKGRQQRLNTNLTDVPSVGGGPEEDYFYDDLLPEEDEDGGTRVLHFDQLCVAAVVPFMRETASRSRVTSKPALAECETHTWRPGCTLPPPATAAATLAGEAPAAEPEFRFTGKELQGMAVGPFLTTREFLANQWFVLHLLPKSSSETKLSAAACVVSLADAADGQTVNFEAQLEHDGQPSGFVRGKFRVWLDAEGWDEEFVANPRLHHLNPAKLTKNYNASLRAHARRKSPAPPGMSAPPTNPLPMWFSRTLAPIKIQQPASTSPETTATPLGGVPKVDAEGEDGVDEFEAVARSNALLNAGPTVNRFQPDDDEGGAVQDEINDVSTKRKSGKGTPLARMFG